MKKKLNVFVWMLALTLLIYSFIKNSPSESLFVFEINIWLYRLFWAIIAIFSIIYHYNTKIRKT
jgi:hypothetical protein